MMEFNIAAGIFHPFATKFERNPLSCHYGSFYVYHLVDRKVHTMDFVTLVVEHWLEREII